VNRDEFKRHMKRDVHTGTGQTRHKDKRRHSAEIELLTRDFLANGGEIEQLPSEQVEPATREAMKFVANGGFEW